MFSFFHRKRCRLEGKNAIIIISHVLSCGGGTRANMIASARRTIAHAYTTTSGRTTRQPSIGTMHEKIAYRHVPIGFRSGNLSVFFYSAYAPFLCRAAPSGDRIVAVGGTGGPPPPLEIFPSHALVINSLLYTVTEISERVTVQAIRVTTSHVLHPVLQVPELVEPNRLTLCLRKKK